MSLERNPMVNFFEALGHNIYECSGSWWYDVQPGVLLALPYYKPIVLDDRDLTALMKKESLKVIRYPTELDSLGFVSNITINENKGAYDMHALHQKACNQTRRGLENCKVEQIEFDYLAKHGLLLNENTAERQGRKSQYTNSNYWKKYCDAAKSVDGVDAWGAFVDGKLACFLIAVETENKWSEWIINHSLTELRNKYPNNALAFTVGQHYLNEKNFNGICYGLGSLEETQAIDHFKSRMGWRIKPIKQRLIFSPKIEFLFSFAKEPCLKLLNIMLPKSHFVRKTSALIRLHKNQIKETPIIEEE